MPEKTARRLSELAPKIMGAFHDLGTHRLEGEQLTMRQYQALIILSASGKLTLTAFCEKLNLAPSTGTELANRMIALGYFHKAANTPDRRKSYLSVTEKGTEVFKRRQTILTESFIRFLGPFSEEDRETFIDCFEQIYALIQKYYQEH